MRPEHPKNKNDILEKAIPLFAQHGYSGVSMRQIAGSVGMNAASLYHHFPDKQTLYIATVQQAFATREFVLSEILAMKIHVHEKLRLFVKIMCDFIKDDPDFSKLLLREILDSEGDETRLQLLADQVFKNFVSAVINLARELAPDKDPHLLGPSLIGLIIYHYQISPIRMLLPGSKPEHNDSQVVADHIIDLVLKGLKS